MPSACRRRKFLQGTGAIVGITASSGCLSLVDSGYPPGTLVVSNEQAESHTVTVTVEKTSDDDDDIHGGQTPSPATTPIWEREVQVTVEGQAKVVQKDFITEPGAFFLEARVENLELERTWVGFYEADGGIAEDAIFLDIQENGQVIIYPSHGD